MINLFMGFLVVFGINYYRDSDRVKEVWKDWAIGGLTCVVLDFLIFVL